MEDAEGAPDELRGTQGDAGEPGGASPASDGDCRDDREAGAEVLGASLAGLRPAACDADVPESLSCEQLLRRRAKAVEDLHRAYKVEYWGLLEELNALYHKLGQQQLGPNEPEKAATFTSVREGLMERRAQATGRASPVSASANGDCAQRDTEMGEVTDNKEPEQVDCFRGYGSDDDPPSFSEAKDLIMAQAPCPKDGGPPSLPHLPTWRSAFKQQLHSIARMESLASSATSRELDELSALAMLVCRRGRYLVRRPAVSLGRGHSKGGQAGRVRVDVDLRKAGVGGKASHLQAKLWLKTDGTFYIHCVGQRKMFVDGFVVSAKSTPGMVVVA
ncbi:unnamed protein product [Ostreobium quekettii]|uniref:FHA domain-containing protein n=1 Tax=Ostreobium quekettii TaxID=121088 RepID=A0A8S1IQX5_9CHLO|nr:unnamed protein product [Ostreobium quekettii]